MTDYYLQNPEALEGQPKRSIADYVEQNGILVPRRFDSLKDARNSGLPVIVRSEHQQDYNGSSGLLGSPDLSLLSGVETDEALREAILSGSYKPEAYRERGDILIKQHCDYLRIDINQFKTQISYSFWEKISGSNLKVVADSAIRDRWHVTSYERPMGPVAYGVCDKNGEASFSVGKFPENLEFENLISAYEKIRSLARFDRKNCPLMEFQHCEGRDYFLQYMRTAEFSEASFRIARKPQDEEVEALFVRGVTPPEGFRLRVNMYYPSEWNEDLNSFSDEASFDFHYDKSLSEILVRKRKAQFIATKDRLNGELLKIAVGHNDASKLFKPTVSVIMDIDRLIKNEEIDEIFDKTEEIKSPQGIDLFLISDGHRAYVRRINEGEA
ncbi:MAG TPA: hypothetical protein VJK03_01075 [Candidatus Nanoarchaeia archaeon]|nr:hypothetical protein [Candidatus Nanoarchaeia archaeon]